MITDSSKAPFWWFGGKQHAAPVVWAALGDVSHYAEPFCGTCAVLLRRPHLANRPYVSETVNDRDGLLCNALRAIQLQPDAVAKAASYYVCEADLHARHLSIVNWERNNDLQALMGDPEWCDPLIAGWWLWGISCWIGGGWCSGKGPWVVGNDGRITRRNGSEPGVCRKKPHLTDDGIGVNIPGAREPGVWDEDDFHPMTMPELRRWFAFLSARLRHVRILNGSWERLVTGGALKIMAVRHKKGVCGIFLDPPYSQGVRCSRIYNSDALGLSEAVRGWCASNGDDPDYRIVLAGFAGEGHEELEALGWRAVEWYQSGYLRGGYANVGKDGNQQHMERLWLSPGCLIDQSARIEQEQFDWGDD